MSESENVCLLHLFLIHFHSLIRHKRGEENACENVGQTERMERTRAQLEWHVFNSLPWHYFFFFCAVLLDNDCQTDCSALNPQTCSRTRSFTRGPKYRSRRDRRVVRGAPTPTLSSALAKIQKKRRRKKKNLSAGLPACLDCNKVSQGISL